MPRCTGSSLSDSSPLAIHLEQIERFGGASGFRDEGAGNKRTAFDSLDTFLAINNAHLTASPERVIEFVMGFYHTNTFRFEHLVTWLRQHVELPKK